MGALEWFIECTINCELTNTTLNISQPDIITKMTKGFKEDVKSLITFKPPKNRIRGLYKINKQTQKYHKI